MVHGSERVLVGGEDGGVDIDEGQLATGSSLMTCMLWRRVTRDSATYAWARYRPSWTTARAPRPGPRTSP